MAQFPWKQRTQVAPGRCYTVVVSKLPLKHRRSIPGFMRDTLTIRRQLRSAPGLIGYSLLAELRQDLLDVLRVGEPGQARRVRRLEPAQPDHPRAPPENGQPIVKFVDDVDGSQLPWGWPEVKRQLQENLG